MKRGVSVKCRRSSGMGIPLVEPVLQRRLAYLFIWLFSFLCGGTARRRHENQQEQGDNHRFTVWNSDCCQCIRDGNTWMAVLSYKPF